MGKFLPPMPRLHSDQLSPTGIDLAKDIALTSDEKLLELTSLRSEKKMFICRHITVALLCRGFGSCDEILGCGNMTVVGEKG